MNRQGFAPGSGGRSVLYTVSVNDGPNCAVVAGGKLRDAGSPVRSRPARRPRSPAETRSEGAHSRPAERLSICTEILCASSFCVIIQPNGCRSDIRSRRRPHLSCPR
jgi:hypothetical protein